MNRQNINILAGEDFEMDLWIKNDDGSAYNLTGCTFKGEVRDRPYGALLGSFAFSAVDAAGGHALATMAHAATSALTLSGKSVYDPVTRHYGIELTTAGGTVLSIAAGYAYVTPEVVQ